MSKVLQLCGTSGAGKSTIVRQIMGLYKHCEPISAQPTLIGLSITDPKLYQVGRKQPIAYNCYNVGIKKPLVVLGAYQTACGGCDIIKPVAKVFDLVRYFRDGGNDVLFEGLFISELVNQVVDLNKENPDLLVLALNVPLEECLKGVNERRTNRGVEQPVNPKNTSNRVKTIPRRMARLETAGVATVWVTREEALLRIKQELSL